MVLLIMAAGSGSRYGKLKQFDELGPNGEFLMEFSIYDAIKSGFNHIVLITKRENKDFLYNYLREKINKSVKLDVVFRKLIIYRKALLLTQVDRNRGEQLMLFGAQGIILMLILRL